MCTMDLPSVQVCGTLTTVVHNYQLSKLDLQFKHDNFKNTALIKQNVLKYIMTPKPITLSLKVFFSLMETETDETQDKDTVN